MAVSNFPPAPYNLDGNQVAPEASWALLQPDAYWPTLHAIRTVCAPVLQQFPFAQNAAALQADLDELHHLAQNRNTANAIAGDFAGRVRKPLSPLLTARASNAAAFAEQHLVGGPDIKTGADLARWFENDTPLLGGWMALNALLRTSPKPPTEQARIWMVLNAAIHAALHATWHYKWHERSTRLKPRPTEVDGTLTVLYATTSTGQPVAGSQPGVPRHPSYPSGHSTVGGATAHVLKHFFPQASADLDALADNAGLARMWAGIHYRTDHEVGMAIGAAVAGLVLEVAG